jgi:hypothetical protein
MTSLISRPRARRHDDTPDSHLFPTREYDLVKEFVVAFAVVLGLTLLLAAVFSSPDRRAITLRSWAAAAPNDVVATATAELAGTSASATYGPPYNSAADGQQIGPVPLAKWIGVHVPINSAYDLVITPLRQQTGDPALASAVRQWQATPPAQRTKQAQAYADALAAVPGGNPRRVSAGSYGPVPELAGGLLRLARSGGLDSALTPESSFYAADQTKALLLLSDGAYLENQARAENLGGDQWGMMNEVGNYPGQPWMWLYTFWYQIEPFSSSGNADALVWGLMVLLSLGFVFLPYLPGVRSLPRYLGVHRLIWRSYRATAASRERPR